MMPSFDGENLIVTLDSGVTEVEVGTDLYSEWKVWYKTGDNSKYPIAFRASGGDPLSSIIFSGSYYFIQNQNGWRIRPPEEDITINFLGSLVGEDLELPIIIPTVGLFRVLILGLQPITQGVTPVMGSQLQYNAFQDKVWVDVIGGIAGTDFPAGTREFPSNDLFNAHTIASAEGFEEFGILGDLTIGTGHSIPNFTLRGQNAINTTIIIDPAADVTKCQIFDATITGTLDGDVVIRDCVVGDVSLVAGFIYQCAFSSTAVITLGLGAVANFLDCFSGTPGVGTPTIDMNGSGTALAIRGYNGGIKIVNKTGAESISLDLHSGQVILGSDVTNGTIVARGVGKLVDESGDDIFTGTWNGVTIINEMVSVNAIWEDHRALTTINFPVYNV